MNKTIIFFPFAGASFYSYRAFEEKCPQNTEIITLEAPGRGKRIAENLIEDINELTIDFYSQIVNNYLSRENIYFFGHSLGAVLALLVVQKLANEGLKLPQHLVLSGKNPPHIKSSIANRHLLSDVDFKKMIENMGGTPKEILENKELLDFFLPILRSDFALIDKANFSIPQNKLDIPVTIISAAEDKNTDQSSLNQWDSYFSKTPKYMEFRGEHFFIFNNVENIFEIILSIK